MKGNTTIARPYARAVFEQARADGELKAWSDMLAVLGLIAADPQMQGLMRNPRVSHAQLTGIVLDICGTRLNEQGKNFVCLLVEARRLGVAGEILRLYQELHAEAEGVATVEIISAYPLEEAQRETIRQKMAARLSRKIEITTHVDQDLIGGAVIRVGDSVIDASLRGRLRQLHRIISG